MRRYYQSVCNTAYKSSSCHTGIVWYKKKDGVIFIPRHGGHPQENPRFGPARTQYAANLLTAYALEARVVVATSAVGSLDAKKIDIGSVVIPDDYIDDTGRDDTLFGKGIVVHANPIPPFSEQLREIMVTSAHEMQDQFNGVHRSGVYVTIPGDRFGTKAEGLRRAAYAHIVGMTICPEAAMALQLGMHYAVAAFPVDVNLDANHEGGTLKVMTEMSAAERVPAYIARVVERAQKTAFGLLPQLRGNIIAGNVQFIANPILKVAAEELKRLYIDR